MTRVLRLAIGLLRLWWSVLTDPVLLLGGGAGIGLAAALALALTAWARRYVLDTAEGASVRPVAVQLVAAGVGGAPSVDWVATVHAIRTTSVGSL